ncbi:hypothetical protein M409DRAFT_29258 [Zasmidium cellare ATCC 36951]|uniref:2EXR domain-containing protein n=1 Tax=Zasmidium cellare ATCC 36951 TaxID=1080233 RepID=A0A6A6C3G2_ZASCE|nr:uncharacterized protein M409DRAFT_29258 [Zasmidium cellare ATCC 36951]KAF2160412.1 hypothetical protein M409DRAFT_29258 [Zasmidium cellare ATCC 36951]
MGAQTWNDPRKTAKHNANSPLLKLPAELRIEIYSLCLISPNRVNLNKPYISFSQRRHPNRGGQLLKVHPPALFRVCRQTRCETIPIYFRKNKFRVFALNYDVKPYARFLRYQRVYGRPEDLVLTYVGQPNWANLVKWLEMVYLKRCAPPERREGFWANRNSVVVEGMFMLVERVRKRMSWKEVLRVLEARRVFLACIDTRWKL